MLIDPASFRDPSGFVFTFENKVYRAVSPAYFENASLFTNSGLYLSLSEKNLIVRHTEVQNFLPAEYASYKIIQPDEIPFISYPYEWCFSQLKAAALLTLKIQKEALAHGMILKDASAYNVQFIGPAPVFIDTLSFEKYREGTPWAAYRQFCQHFLAPLALMYYKKAELSRLLTSFIDGIPLELAANLLPLKSWTNSVVLSHLHFHSKFKASHAKEKMSAKAFSLSKKQLLSLIEHMEGGIDGWHFRGERSAWSNYDVTHNYTDSDKKIKGKIISEWVKRINPTLTMDVGCNTGEYAILASQYSKYICAIDSDHTCIERLYSSTSQKKIQNVLPLVADITNPSPGIGWNNRERQSLPNRKKMDLIMALALVHHLRIGNNTPWSAISKFFSNLGNWLIVEFVPPEDSQIRQMLHNRENIFHDLAFDSFLKYFEHDFELTEKKSLADSSRILCLFKKK